MKKLSFGIVVSRYNQGVTQGLLDGAMRALKQNRVPASAVRVVWVPGAFEIPLAAQRLAKSKKVSAVIALGCVLKGQTDHNRYISQACADGLMQIMLQTGVPVTFGVLTPDNLKQARERSGSGSANKGSEAAYAALDMVENAGENHGN